MKYIATCLSILLVSHVSVAAEPVTLENVVDPGANKADEPLLKKFSLNKATHFLDSAALQWQKQRKCFTCHTNYAFLYARPAISAGDATHETVRKFAEQLVQDRWKEKGPRWDAEVVATAAALADNDSATTGDLHATTKTALDRMWTVQRDDGGWDWLKCGWPPMESDDHYGATLAAIAVGVAPEEYSKSEQARKGMTGIKKYLEANPPENMHHQMMILWAASYHDDLMSAKDKEALTGKLLKLQNDDGGWSLPKLFTWERADEKEQDTSSDGYATGFVVFVLRQTGVPTKDKSIQRGVAWLKSNQRESGRWFTRSINKDSRHFITHAGTAMALMALGQCGELGGN